MLKNSRIYDYVVKNLCEELNTILTRIPSNYKEKSRGNKAPKWGAINNFIWSQGLFHICKWQY